MLTCWPCHARVVQGCREPQDGAGSWHLELAGPAWLKLRCGRPYEVHDPPNRKPTGSIITNPCSAALSALHGQRHEPQPRSIMVHPEAQYGSTGLLLTTALRTYLLRIVGTTSSTCSRTLLCTARYGLLAPSPCVHAPARPRTGQVCSLYVAPSGDAFLNFPTLALHTANARPWNPPSSPPTSLACVLCILRVKSTMYGIHSSVANAMLVQSTVSCGIYMHGLSCLFFLPPAAVRLPSTSLRLLRITIRVV